MLDSQAPSTPQVRTLLLTDLVDSTGLVERIGDTAAAALFRAHDRIVLDLQQRWRGRLIDRSDGLLLIFERPIDGLGFALDYVRGLRELGREHNQPLQARAGLHVGEVLLWENSLDAVQLGAKSLEVEGLAKPLAGRLMALARPGQILLSATAEPLAHRAARELGERGELLVWKSYGRWRFKGVPEAQEIYEVGEPGLAPLRMPSHTPKAWRDLPLWRRPVALAAETMLLAGLLVGGWFITRPQPAIAFGERDWVVVGDLRNLTGDPRLDDSLEQAFRISLEQSRYVNVLSDLKVRETLQRMQRGNDAKIDRASGSEIAMRDGARALLLPTVAEVGGRLRVSAEVVDPRTQTTVYAVSADGKGIESALASIDDVTDQLREQLGEAMQNVQKTSVPLPNVATPSLEALKAFAVARNVVYTTRDREQALGLYRRALQLDPQFALAHADMAQLLAGFGEVGAAAGEWRKALAIPGRLSPQEKLRIELMLLQHTPPAAYFRKVDEYLALYPDDSQVISRSGDQPLAPAQRFPWCGSEVSVGDQAGVSEPGQHPVQPRHDAAGPGSACRSAGRIPQVARMGVQRLGRVLRARLRCPRQACGRGPGIRAKLPTASRVGAAKVAYPPGSIVATWRARVRRRRRGASRRKTRAMWSTCCARAQQRPVLPHSQSQVAAPVTCAICWPRRGRGRKTSMRSIRRPRPNCSSTWACWPRIRATARCWRTYFAACAATRWCATTRPWPNCTMCCWPSTSG
jgi:class 3 adenylate cyclase/tetratricopeptide (TPR) repeat protein